LSFVSFCLDNFFGRKSYSIFYILLMALVRFSVDDFDLIPEKLEVNEALFASDKAYRDAVRVLFRRFLEDISSEDEDKSTPSSYSAFLLDREEWSANKRYRDAVNMLIFKAEAKSDDTVLDFKKFCQLTSYKQLSTILEEVGDSGETTVSAKSFIDSQIDSQIGTSNISTIGSSRVSFDFFKSRSSRFSVDSMFHPASVATSFRRTTKRTFSRVKKGSVIL